MNASAKSDVTASGDVDKYVTCASHFTRYSRTDVTVTLIFLFLNEDIEVCCVFFCRLCAQVHNFRDDFNKVAIHLVASYVTESEQVLPPTPVKVSQSPSCSFDVTKVCIYMYDVVLSARSFVGSISTS